MSKLEAYNGVIYNFLSTIPLDVLNQSDYNLVKSDLKKAIDNSKLYYRVMVDNKNYYECEIVNANKDLDAAIIKVKGGNQGFKPILMGDSDQLKVGGLAITIGYPMSSVFFEVFKDLKSSMTTGTISAIRSSDNWGIQHTAAINPGNSGGPLLNKNGEAVGINVGTFYDTSGLYFSIPINKVKVWLNSIGLNSLNQANKEDTKNFNFYKNRNVEYTSLNKNIHVNLPEGYTVYVNGMRKGNTPINIKNIPLGIATIRIESNEEYSEQKFNVENISDDFYEYIPIMNKFTGSLYINSNPVNAKLFIDDVDVGMTPYKIDSIVIGKHKIKFMLDGYMPLEKEIEISRDESKKIIEKLIKGVRITFKDKLPTDTQIKITKKDKVNLYKYNDPILLYPDKYEMEISSSKFDSQKISLDLSNGNDMELDLKLNLFKSKLILKNLKKESIVVIDNIDITSKIENNSYELEIGEHEVKITTKDFKQITKKINIEKDKNFVMNLIYIGTNVSSESFYTARNVLLGIGIPVIITGSLLTIIGVIGFCVMEFAVIPVYSYFFSYSHLINQRASVKY